jgi:hypothetical protein
MTATRRWPRFPAGRFSPSPWLRHRRGSSRPLVKLEPRRCCRGDACRRDQGAARGHAASQRSVCAATSRRARSRAEMRAALRGGAWARVPADRRAARAASGSRVRRVSAAHRRRSRTGPRRAVRRDRQSQAVARRRARDRATSTLFMRAEIPSSKRPHPQSLSSSEPVSFQGNALHESARTTC